MGSLINCYACANLYDYPGLSFGGFLYNIIDHAASPAKINSTKELIKTAKPIIKIQDNSGFNVLSRELKGEKVLLDNSKPITYKGIPNPTALHNVDTALALRPDILIISDWPVKQLKEKAEQEAEFQKKLHYNISTVEKTTESLRGKKHNLKLYVPFQGYSLEHSKRFFGSIRYKDLDGVAMPIRGQSIEQTALFLLSFWQMGFRKLHLLGVAGLFPMALAAYFARHFYGLVTLDGQGWKIKAKHSLYSNPHSLQPVYVGEEVYIDPNVQMDCQCPTCRGRFFVYFQEIPYYFRRIQLSLHNFWAVEGMGQQLLNHASTITELLSFLNRRTNRKKEILQLQKALFLVEALKDKPLDKVKELFN